MVTEKVIQHWHESLYFYYCVPSLFFLAIELSLIAFSFIMEPMYCNRRMFALPVLDLTRGPILFRTRIFWHVNLFQCPTCKPVSACFQVSISYLAKVSDTETSFCDQKQYSYPTQLMCPTQKRVSVSDAKTCFHGKPVSACFQVIISYPAYVSDKETSFHVQNSNHILHYLCDVQHRNKFPCLTQIPVSVSDTKTSFHVNFHPLPSWNSIQEFSCPSIGDTNTTLFIPLIHHPSFIDPIHLSFAQLLTHSKNVFTNK